MTRPTPSNQPASGERTEQLLREAPWIRRLAFSLAGPSYDAGDLEQELWEAALANGPSQPGALKAWLRSTAHNLRAMRLRSAARRQRREQTAARPEGILPTDELLARAELHRKLLDALDRLPAAQKEAVLLRWFEGLNPKGIAAELQVPVATVHTRLQRAKERLRNELDDGYGSRAAWVPLGLLGLPPAGTAGAAASAEQPSGHGMENGSATALKTALLIHAMTTKPVLTTLTSVAALAVGALWLSGAWDATSWPDQPTQTMDSTIPDQVAAPPATLRPGSQVELSREATDAPTPEAEPALPPEGFGIVVDHQDQPLAGVEVRFAKLFWEETGTWPEEQTLVTDGRGLFPMQAEEFNWYQPRLPGYLSVQDENRQSANARNPDGPTILRMVPLLDAPLSVSVIDKVSGQPIPRFELSVRSVWQQQDGEGDPRTLQHEDPAQLDCRNGRYTGTARFVLGGSHSVVVRADGSAPGTILPEEDRRAFVATVRTQCAQKVRPVAGEPLSVQLELDLGWVERRAPHGTLGGDVFALDGETPLAGVGVALVPEGKRNSVRDVQTDRLGAYRIAALPRGEPASLRFTHPELETVEVGIPQSARDQERMPMVRMGTRGSLTITVIGRNGRPMPMAAWQVFQVEGAAKGFNRRGYTDENGQFRLPALVSGTYMAMVMEDLSSPDEDGGLARGSFRVDPGQTVEGTIRLGDQGGLVIQGRVLDADGSPLAERGVLFLSEQPGGAPAMAKVDAGGYRIEDLPAGRYTVMIVNPETRGGVAPVVLPGIEVLESGAMDLQVPSSGITGRLVGYADATELSVVALCNAPKGSIAAAMSSNPGALMQRAIQASSDGRFSIPQLAPGTWTLKAYTGLGREARSRGERPQVIATRRVTVDGDTPIGDWVIE